MIRVLVVGYGYCGPHLVRTLVYGPSTQPVGTRDRDPSRLASARQVFPFIDTFTEIEAALSHGVDAVLIATPASTHYPLAVRCLEAGKHLLVEKPITRTSAEARDLIARANRAGRVLMVDH